MACSRSAPQDGVFHATIAGLDSLPAALSRPAAVVRTQSSNRHAASGQEASCARIAAKPLWPRPVCRLSVGRGARLGQRGARRSLSKGAAARCYARPIKPTGASRIWRPVIWPWPDPQRQVESQHPSLPALREGNAKHDVAAISVSDSVGPSERRVTPAGG
jgi:hypothetical protein